MGWLKTTPFPPLPTTLGVTPAGRRWAGFIVASSYELSHDREYHAIRGAAALFDVSPLYKYSIRGKDAATALNLPNALSAGYIPQPRINLIGSCQ